MPQGLKNAPQIYQRMLDNALWGFVRPAKGWDSAIDEVNEEGVEQDIFTVGVPEDSKLVPVLRRRSYIDDLAFACVSWIVMCELLRRFLMRMRVCGITLSLPKSQFGKKKVNLLSHSVSEKGIEATPKDVEGFQQLPFPTSKKGIQSFLGTLNYYNKFIQDFSAIAAILYELVDEDFQRSQSPKIERAKKAFSMLQGKLRDTPLLRHLDNDKEIFIIVYANRWAIGATIAQKEDEVLLPFRFVSRVLKSAELRYHPAELEVLALLRALKVYYHLLAGRRIVVYSRYSTLKWIFTAKALFGRPLQFAAMLSPWSLEVHRAKPSECAISGLLVAGLSPPSEVDKELEEIFPVKVDGSAHPRALYNLLPRKYTGHLMSFDGGAMPPKQGGFGSCGFILWHLPEWRVIHAERRFLEAATVNEAEYEGLIQGLKVCRLYGVRSLTAVGDSRIAIQQSMRAVNCHKDTLQLKLTQVDACVAEFESVKFIHVVRDYNMAADHLARRAIKEKKSSITDLPEDIEALHALNRLPSAVYEPEEFSEDGEKEPVPTQPEEEVCNRDVQETAPSRVPYAEEGGEMAVESSATMSPAVSTTEAAQKVLGESDAAVAAACSLDTAEETAVALCESPVDTVPTMITACDTSCETVTETAREESDETAKRFVSSATPGIVVEEGQPLYAQQERLRRIALAQEEEERWHQLKLFMNGELDKLTQQQASRCTKEVELYVMGEKGALYYTGRKVKSTVEDDEDRQFRLVVPTTLQRDFIAAAHSELQGGHQGVTRTYMRLKKDYYWPGMFADVQRYVSDCSDCCSGKGKPRLRGHSPGNLLANRPFQVVSMDFAIPLLETARGNTALLLFQCSFTGYVICKPMRDTSAQAVAEAFEECIFRRFGACEILRHDRDPRFMSEVFKAFNKMMRQQQRATLSYRPQANGQQERSVQTMIQTIRIYASDPKQRDWDDLAEKLVFALNTSYDFSRRETPFYLVHGWDARSTVKASLPSVNARGGTGDAASWRRYVKRSHDYALALAWKLQQALKRARADEANARRRLHLGDDGETQVEEEIAEGDAVWLYMARVKPGFSKKLAHLWHGPFRVQRRVNEFSVALELPDREGYRFHPVVHVSRLKLRRTHPERPDVRLAEGVDERFDFDEELLPEDSFVNVDVGEYEVEALLDMKWKRGYREGRREKEYLVRWVGHEEPTWVCESNLSCGSLILQFEEQQRRWDRMSIVQTADESEETAP